MPRASSHHRLPTPPVRRRRVISPRPHVHEEEGAKPVHPSVLQHAEKRRLILAHAEARRERPRGFSFIHYVAVTASCLVVMVGWWMTVERNFALPPVSSRSFTGIFQESLQSANEQQQRIFPSSNSRTTSLDRRLEGAQQDLRQEEQQAQVMDQTARRLVQPLSTSSAASTTSNTR